MGLGINVVNAWIQYVTIPMQHVNPNVVMGGFGLSSRVTCHKKTAFCPLAFLINVFLHASLTIALCAFHCIVARAFFGIPIINISSTFIPNLALIAHCVFLDQKKVLLP